MIKLKSILKEIKAVQPSEFSELFSYSPNEHRLILDLNKVDRALKSEFPWITDDDIQKFMDSDWGEAFSRQADRDINGNEKFEKSLTKQLKSKLSRYYKDFTRKNND